MASENPWAWTVPALRKYLRDAGVSSTGSREMLLSRIEACSRFGGLEKVAKGAKAKPGPAQSKASPRLPVKKQLPKAKASPAGRQAMKAGRPQPKIKIDKQVRQQTKAKVEKTAVTKGGDKKLDKLRTELTSETLAKLKEILKANDQSRNGNKAVLAARVADGRLYGRLPRCPKCYGGKVKFRLQGAGGAWKSLFRMFGGAYGEDKIDDAKEDNVQKPLRYYCTGYYDDDEKVECDWQADKVKREAWEEA
mmetsp:Transcript_72665/g.135779  ORF Transcript_72665/g.135779 Transcript_72665/m.135779 type:complete len:250 (-) Transcript_72665:198-947(-)